MSVTRILFYINMNLLKNKVMKKVLKQKRIDVVIVHLVLGALQTHRCVTYKQTETKKSTLSNYREVAEPLPQA